MNMRFLSKFVIASIAFPILFLGIWELVSFYPDVNRQFGGFISFLNLIFVPSSILMIAGAEGGAFATKLWFIALAVNIVWYIVLSIVISWFIKIAKK